MIEIPLTQGKVALIDDEDFARVSLLTWRVGKGSGKSRVIWYARAMLPRNGQKQRQVLLHRYILGLAAVVPVVDHADDDGLNCQKSNLRICTHAQNLAKRRPWAKSGWKGVYAVFHRGVIKWQSAIFVDSRKIYLGLFDAPELAALAYNEAARQYHGKFARIND